MSTNSNKISQFWKELKRRSVLRSLAVYAGSAFVFLEASTIIFPRWGFPDWTIDLVLYLLILGGFITIVVAWIFDITPEGVQKTKPADEVPGSERPTDSKAWKAATYISLVVIVALITFNVVTSTKTNKTGSIQSLIILPFDNFTGADSLDYFVSGMHSSLITDMQQISALRVIGRTTANSFKGTDLSLTQIASKLKVDAAVEGAISFLGKDSVCVQIGVIRSKGEEKQLWVEDFRVAKDQILNFYSDVTKKISEEINIVLTPEEERLLAQSRTVNREAYDAYLRSQQYWGDLSKESLNKAREYLNSAIEKDPNWAPLYAGLAQVWLGLAQMGYVSPEIAIPEVYKNLNKALELDPDHTDAHYLNALMAYLAEWNWEKAENEFLKAIAINPNDSYSRIFYAHLLYILQRPNEAAVQARLAYELDPLNPQILITYSYALLCAHDCETAMIQAEKAVEIDPESFGANNQLGQAAFPCKDYDKAFETEKFNLQVYSYSTGQFDEDTWNEFEMTYKEKGYFAAYEEILHQYEVLYKKGFINPGVMAIFYITGNKQDKAMDCLVKGYEIHDPQMPYIATGGYPFDSLYDNPRFIDILEKMNLPLPEK